MKKLELIAVGACNVDLLLQVDRLAEIDDEVSINQFEIKPGGSAANVACMVSKLGHKSGFIGTIGQDRFGHFLLDKLGELSVDTSNVLLSGTSGMVVAIIKEGNRYLYTYGGSPSCFSPAAISDDYLSQAEIVHLASIDSPTGIDIIEKAARLSDKAGAKVIFDPGHLFVDRGLEALEPILKYTYAFLPSESEIKKLVKAPLPEAANKLLSLGPQVVVVTRGARGSYLVTKNKQTVVPPVTTGKVKSSLGAGDAFSAGFISGLLKDKNLVDAAHLGNLIASKSLTQKGATFSF